MTGLLLGDDNCDRVEGGESEYTSRRLLTPDSKLTQESPKPFSSVWKPVWYTGWHTAVLACATSVTVVFFINVSLTIYAATNPEYKMKGGIGTLYEGSCDKSKTIGLWLHLGINALSTLLLSGSNYTQQCLSAPTRSEIDAAHARRRWMDIGIPSIRNLFRIKLERRLLWMAIGFTSIPLHLLYNSAVFSSFGANSFVVSVVTKDHFEPGAYWNITEAMPEQDGYGPSDWELFRSVLEGYKSSINSYEELVPSACARLYNTDYLSNHRNLFVITQHNSNTTENNTLLDMTYVTDGGTWLSTWMCFGYSAFSATKPGPGYDGYCNPNELASKVASGHPWRMKLTTGEETEIIKCKSEKTAEKCKVQFSLEIMIVVICCNLIKACCMIMAVIRSHEPTLVTLGDAVDSFLRIPDQTTIGMCFADRQFIKREWRRRWRTEPGQWKQKEVKRWWASVSKTRWIICNLFCLIIVIVAGVSLRLGMDLEGQYWNTDIKSLWNRGFGKANRISQVDVKPLNITQAILLVNLPQTVLSLLYLTYNSYFTSMLLGHEWSLFSHHYRTLRVTSPRLGQRSTYWLQIPYTYAIPLMAFSGLLHWLTSQSLFLVVLELFDLVGKEAQPAVPALGYSCIAIIFVLMLGVIAFVTAAGMGYKQFAAEITSVGSCSAAISAACHASGAHLETIVGKKIRWGDVGIEPYLGVRHLTFSSEEGVRKPVFGETYLGSGREGE